MPSDIASSFALLAPHPWSAVSGMAPASRVKRFFLPGSDDLEEVTAAHQSLVDYIAGEITFEAAEERFVQARGSAGAAYRVAAQFYKHLFLTAEKLLTHFNPVQQKSTPNVAYVSAECCPRCEVMAGIVMPWGSEILQVLCPPWNISCQCFVEDSADEPSQACEELLATNLEGDEEHFCTPIDLLITLGWKPNE